MHTNTTIELTDINSVTINNSIHIKENESALHRCSIKCMSVSSLILTGACIGCLASAAIITVPSFIFFIAHRNPESQQKILNLAITGALSLSGCTLFSLAACKFLAKNHFNENSGNTLTSSV